MSSISYKTAKIQWQHKPTNGGNYKTLSESSHYNMSHYIWSLERPREYIMTLEIKEVINSDFGAYRCSVSDNFGGASVDVQLNVASMGMAKPSPPETTLECCKKRGVEDRCLTMCGATESSTDVKRYSPRPFMPFNCSVQISKVKL
jgi:hypothetical protein